jgi:hypothetical protein
VFGFWLSDLGKDDFVFAKEPGGGGGEALTALPPLAATHSAYNG